MGAAVQTHDVEAPDSSVSIRMNSLRFHVWGGDSISSGEELLPTSTSHALEGGLFMATNNPGKITKIRELFNDDWLPGEDSWIYEEIKEKPGFTRDPIECASAIKARDNILAMVFATTLFGKYASHPH